MKKPVEDLSKSITTALESVPALTAAQLAEIDRRLDEHLGDPASAVPREEVRARLWSRIR